MNDKHIYLLATLGMALALVALVGCTTDDEGFVFDRCDCNVGEICRDGICYPEDAWVGGDLAGDNGTGPSTCDQDSAEGLLINELAYRVTGNDLGYEFVELVGAPGARLDGYTFRVLSPTNGSISFSQRLEGVFDEEGYFVLGQSEIEPRHQEMDCTNRLGCILNTAASVQILGCDGATVVDAMGYGSFSNPEYYFGRGDPAPTAPEGRSLARCPGVPNSDDNATDFGVADPTPGDENSGFTTPGFCVGGGNGEDPDTCDPETADELVINELVYRVAGNDLGYEFIELRGRPGASVTGYTFRVRTGLGAIGLEQVLVGEFNENGLFVLGQGEILLRDQDMACTAATGCIPNTGETVKILGCEGEIVDALGYGTFSGRDSYGLGEPAPHSPVGMSLARCPEADNTENNATDFGAAQPTPGLVNGDFNDPTFCANGGNGEDPDPCDPEAAVDLVINELLYRVSGNDLGFEFIELRGQPGAKLTGYTFRVRTGLGTIGLEQRLVGEINENGLFVLGQSSVLNRDQDMACTAATGCIPNTGETVKILGCEGEIVDALGYGTFTTRTSYGFGDPAPHSPEGLSLARCPDAPDTQDNATDFGAAYSSPGAPNEEFYDAEFCVHSENGEN